MKSSMRRQLRTGRLQPGVFVDHGQILCDLCAQCCGCFLVLESVTRGLVGIFGGFCSIAIILRRLLFAAFGWSLALNQPRG